MEYKKTYKFYFFIVPMFLTLLSIGLYANGNINKKQFTKIHIASYRDEKTANKGAIILQNKYNNSYNFQMEINYENIKGKGWYYRIYFIGESKDIIPLCEKIKKSGNWCDIVKSTIHQN